MIYGELGRYPIEIDIKLRCISFWGRLVSGKQTKISHILYRLCKTMHDSNVPFCWMAFIQKILNECGYSYVWNFENFESVNWLKNVVKQRLIDQFVQNWNSKIFESPKAFNYRIFKTNFEFEEYFNILQLTDALKFCRFRTSNHKLPIVKG